MKNIRRRRSDGSSESWVMIRHVAGRDFVYFVDDMPRNRADAASSIRKARRLLRADISNFLAARSEALEAGWML